jgi:hypothetical protein
MDSTEEKLVKLIDGKQRDKMSVLREKLGKDTTPRLRRERARHDLTLGQAIDALHSRLCAEGR